MTVQDIANSVANDVRQVLSPVAPDGNIFVPWIDRIHKDVLHTSLFNHLLHGIQAIAVTLNQAQYTLTNPARRITLVYDRTFERVLLPIEALLAPTTKGDAQMLEASTAPKPIVSATTMSEWPEYYKRNGQIGLFLFPAPQKQAFTGLYEVHYESYAPDLTTLTDLLLVPNDGKDLITAGVNWEACKYLKLATEAAEWRDVYESMKKGMGI